MKHQASRIHRKSTFWLLLPFAVLYVFAFSTAGEARPPAAGVAPERQPADLPARNASNYHEQLTQNLVAGDEPSSAGIATLEDFDDMVTPLDFGFNDFAGNMGAVNEQYLQPVRPECVDALNCHVNLDWDFGADQKVFTGLFMSLFGLKETLTTFDGTTVETIAFPEHALNLDDIDGALREPAGSRRFEEVCLRLDYTGEESLALRVELKDSAGGVRFTRLVVAGSTAPQSYCWDFRTDYSTPASTPDMNTQHAKEFTIVVEHVNVADGIHNPTAGGLDLHHIWFTLNWPETEPVDDQALLDLAALRAYQYFLDWSSRKPQSMNIPQDRSTFGDLLTVGGIGFGLSAHVVAAERGWISRADAAQRVLDVLTVLDDPAAFGPERVGRIGYKGWFYHFLGVDGRRKLNFDFPATPEKDESLDTVELSSIDTGLAAMGVLAAQSYFDDPNDSVETQIRVRAQAIYDRVEWDFMLEPERQQFYLGWKPNEAFEGPPFAVPDGANQGHFSGEVGRPQTLDYYTDEALIIILLAAGSDTHPVSPDVYHKLIMAANAADEGGLIRTWPGALFTYQFLPAFLDTRTALSSCPATSWFQNTELATWQAIHYADFNPKGYATYGPDAWGISAAEGPFDAYHAYGAPPLAIGPMPEEDGTITYYGMLSSASFGDDLRRQAIAALRAAWARDHWHTRFGLPDAFNDEIAQAVPEDGMPPGIYRQSGPWVNRALFAIDEGPMLLHLENARGGLIWRLLAQNPNIRRGLQRIEPREVHRIVLEGEDGQSGGSLMSRSNAWGQRTLLLSGDNREVTWTFTTPAGADSTVRVRYSNDNLDDRSGETVALTLDGLPIGQFVAEDTGSGGFGWNTFAMSRIEAIGDLGEGTHSFSLSTSGGDGWGIEIDAIEIHYQTELRCLFLPYLSR